MDVGRSYKNIIIIGWIGCIGPNGKRRTMRKRHNVFKRCRRRDEVCMTAQTAAPFSSDPCMLQMSMCIKEGNTIILTRFIWRVFATARFSAEMWWQYSWAPGNAKTNVCSPAVAITVNPDNCQGWQFWSCSVHTVSQNAFSTARMDPWNAASRVFFVVRAFQIEQRCPPVENMDEDSECVKTFIEWAGATALPCKTANQDAWTLLSSTRKMTCQSHYLRWK